MNTPACRLSVCLFFLLQCVVSQVSAAVERTEAGNTYFSGGEVRINEPVHGDLFATGRQIFVDQPVAADAALAGGMIEVREEIGEDLRAAGGTISIYRNVGGEVLAAGRSVRIENAVDVGGPALLAGNEVAVGGTVNKGIKVYANKIVLFGRIAGDARLFGEEIALMPGTRIEGNLYYASPKALTSDEAATVAGRVTREESSRAGDAGRGIAASGPGWFHPLFFFSMFASGALLFLVFPGAVKGAQHAIRQYPGKSLLIGLVLLSAIPPIAVIMMISVIGIPVGFSLIALYPLLLLLGYLGAAFFIGQRAADAMKQSSEVSLPRQLAYLGFALLLLGLAAMIPFLGMLFVCLALLAGVGGWAIWSFGRIQGLRNRHGDSPETA